MADKLLLVDDEPSVIQSLRRALLDEPFDLFAAGSADEALELLGEHPFKVVVSDERMPGMGGGRVSLSGTKPCSPGDPHHAFGAAEPRVGPAGDQYRG